MDKNIRPKLDLMSWIGYTHCMKGKYVRTPETIEKMRISHTKNPTKYWLGKKLPIEMIERQKESRRTNGLVGNKDYFKSHKYIGEEHALWKGDSVGYDALHTWLHRTMGRPETCEFCLKTNLKGKKIHWANKSGKYKRDVTDWIRLCAKCHYHYDRD